LYLDVLSLVMKADGVVLLEELETVDAGLRRLGIVRESEKLETIINRQVQRIDDIDFKPAESLLERETLVTVTLAVAWCDGDYHEAERAIVETVAQRLSIPTSRLNELEAIVRTGREAAMAFDSDSGGGGGLNG